MARRHETLILFIIIEITKTTPTNTNDGMCLFWRLVAQRTTDPHVIEWLPIVAYVCGKFHPSVKDFAPDYISSLESGASTT